MEEKKRIGFDADDSLIKTMEPLNRFHNAKYGKKLTLEDYKTYYFSQTWEMPEEQAVRDVQLFYESEFYDQIEVTEGALEAVNYLSKKSYLDVITFRPGKNIEKYLHATFSKLFLPDSFSNVYHIERGNNPQIQKWEKCKECNIPILIDDYHEHLILAAGQGIYGILLPAPWNKDITDLPKKITKVRNLYEAVEVIEWNEKVIWD
jgi:uncharacterized HAD superfamily protein